MSSEGEHTGEKELDGGKQRDRRWSSNARGYGASKTCCSSVAENGSSVTTWNMISRSSPRVVYTLCVPVLLAEWGGASESSIRTTRPDKDESEEESPTDEGRETEEQRARGHTGDVQSAAELCPAL
jgi:hypothetical protein